LQAKIDGKMVGAALNDIVITRTNLTKTPIVTIKVLDYPISQKMDGVVISTPTGSTGHALSLGGPIVHENMNCVMILPIAPVNKTPALIVDMNDISISSTDSSKIIIDGQQVFDSKWKSNIVISKYPYDGVFLRIGKRGVRQLEKLGF
jgi:NAD+ kinase